MNPIYRKPLFIVPLLLIYGFCGAQSVNSSGTVNHSAGYNSVNVAGQSSPVGTSQSSSFINHAGFIFILNETELEPEAPVIFSCTGGNRSIALNWYRNTETNFGRYRIYGGTAPNPTAKIDSTETGIVSDTFRIIPDLATGSLYYFRITAVSDEGLESDFSNEVRTLPIKTANTVTDFDGNIYNTVRIGDQLWMQENLHTTHYADGRPVTNYAFNDNESLVEAYGRYYTWNAAMDGAGSSNSIPSNVQGVCPSRWHLPSYDEWSVLFNSLGGQTVAGGKLKESTTIHWTSPNTGGDNSSGFMAVPSGNRGSTGIWGDLLTGISFWTTTHEDWRAYNEYLAYNTASVQHYLYDKLGGVSVRCLKDQEIHIESPNGGETLEGLSEITISWNSVEPYENVRIEYSSDNGISWHEIVVDAPNEVNGSFAWNVPNITSNHCLVRITETDGFPSDVSDAVFTINAHEETQNIELKSGWNLFSTFVSPDFPDVMDLVQPLVSQGILEKVQDQAGAAIERIPGTGNWIDNIGEWNYSEGYKIRVNRNSVLSITGVLIETPATINLTAGWNIIAYPIPAVQDATDALSTLMASGNLVKIQNESGAAIERIPLSNNWIDNIGTLVPGEAYKVRVSADGTLVFNGVSGSVPLKTTSEPKPTSHFRPVSVGNGVDHMNVYVSDNSLTLHEGDEIGVYDGDLCVGTYGVSGTENEYYSIVVSADDPMTPTKDGFNAGNRIQIRLWKGGLEIGNPEMCYTEGFKDKFEPLGTTFAVLKKSGFDSEIGMPYPNPFRTTIHIPYSITEESEIDLSVYNLTGQKVATLVNGRIVAGEYDAVWNGQGMNNEKLQPGIYLIKLNSGGRVTTRQLGIIE